MTNETTTKIPFLRKITPYDKDGKAGTLQLVLGNGSTIELPLDQVSQSNQVRAIWHGLSQRLGDSVAGLSKDKLFDLAEKDIRAIIAVLATDEWDRKVSAKGPRVDSADTMHDLATAIAKLKKAVFDGVFEVVRNAEQSQRDVWKKNPQIDAIMKDLAAKRAKEGLKEKGVETDFDFPSID